MKSFFLRVVFFFLCLGVCFRPGLAEAPVVQKNYSRIVSLAPAITEILFALGAGDRIAGVTTYCEYPEEAKLKPKVGGYTEQNLEAIIAVKPDLVIINPNSGTKFTNEKLKQIGIETLIVPLYSLEDLEKSYRLIGEKIGTLESAKVLESQLLGAIEKQSKRRTGEMKKVVFINWHTPLVIAGGASLENDVIELSGGHNIAKISKDRYPRWNIEAFFEYEPDMIIDASRHGKNINLETQRAMTVKFWRQYPELKAVKKGEIYIFKDDVYSAPGPRTVKFIEAMGEILNPESKSTGRFYERVKP